MNQWDDRIRTHQVWKEMENLGPVIDQVAGIDSPDSEAPAAIARIRAVLTYAGKRLAAADPMLSVPAPLDDMTSQLLAVRTELTTYISDQNAGHLQSANVYSDKILVDCAQIPALSSPDELGALVRAATEYRGIVERDRTNTSKTIEDLRNSITNLGQTTTALTTEVQNERAKLAQVVSDHQGQFSSSQEARSKEFSDAMRTAQQELTKLSSDYQSQFSSGQDLRSNEFTGAQGIRQNKFNELLADYEKKLTAQDADFTQGRNELLRKNDDALVELQSNFNESAKFLLEEIQSKKADVEKLVGVIGNLGVTSGYLRNANNARISMWIWQCVTVLSLIALVVTAYITLSVLNGQGGHYNWEAVVGRVLLLASLGVLAAYGGSQADKQFIEEKRNRKLALELEAIGPYLSSLPAEEQNRFRVNVGERSFGRDDQDHLVHRKSPVSVFDALKSKRSEEVMDILINLAKKAVDPK